MSINRLIETKDLLLEQPAKSLSDLNLVYPKQRDVPSYQMGVLIQNNVPDRLTIANRLAKC